MADGWWRGTGEYDVDWYSTPLPSSSRVGRCSEDGTLCQPCSTAYLLTRAGAAALLAHANSVGFENVTDIFLNRFLLAHDRHYIARPLLATTEARRARAEERGGERRREGGGRAWRITTNISCIIVSLTHTRRHEEVSPLCSRRPSRMLSRGDDVARPEWAPPSQRRGSAVSAARRPEPCLGSACS